jgi:hypothetical protein
VVHPAKECHQDSVPQAKECHQVKAVHPAKVSLQVVVLQVECHQMAILLQEIVHHQLLVTCSATTHCSHHQSDTLEFRKQWWNKRDKK